MRELIMQGRVLKYQPFTNACIPAWQANESKKNKRNIRENDGRCLAITHRVRCLNNEASKQIDFFKYSNG